MQSGINHTLTAKARCFMTLKNNSTNCSYVLEIVMFFVCWNFKVSNSNRCAKLQLKENESALEVWALKLELIDTLTGTINTVIIFVRISLIVTVYYLLGPWLSRRFSSISYSPPQPTTGVKMSLPDVQSRLSYLSVHKYRRYMWLLSVLCRYFCIRYFLSSLMHPLNRKNALQIEDGLFYPGYWWSSCTLYLRWTI